MKRECWKELALVMWHIVTFSCIAGDADQTWSSCCNWDHVQFVPIFRLVPDSMLFVFFFSLTPETLWVIYLTHFMLMGKYRRCNRPPFFICVLHHSVLLWSYRPRTRGVDVVGMFFSLPVVLGVWTAGSWVWWLLLAFEFLFHWEVVFADIAGLLQVCVLCELLIWRWEQEKVSHELSALICSDR